MNYSEAARRDAVLAVQEDRIFECPLCKAIRPHKQYPIVRWSSVCRLRIPHCTMTVTAHE